MIFAGIDEKTRKVMVWSKNKIKVLNDKQYDSFLAKFQELEKMGVMSLEDQLVQDYLLSIIMSENYLGVRYDSYKGI